MPSTSCQTDSTSVELKITVTDDNTENSHSDSKDDLLDNSSDTSAQHKTTGYGIELSQEDKITVLAQTADSKLSDIRWVCLLLDHMSTSTFIEFLAMRWLLIVTSVLARVLP